MKAEIIKQDEELTNEDTQYVSITEKRLHEGSLIERIGSYVPPNRHGYTDSKIENRIKDSTANTLYAKRAPLATSIVNNTYSEMTEVLNSSLMNAKISPNSVQGWDDYIFLLVEREGGKDLFLKRLDDELKAIQQAQRHTLITWLFVLALTIVVACNFVAVSGHLHRGWYEVVGAFSLAAIGSFMFYGFTVARNNRRNIFQWKGKDSKRTDQFVTHTKAQMLR